MVFKPKGKAKVTPKAPRASPSPAKPKNTFDASTIVSAGHDHMVAVHAGLQVIQGHASFENIADAEPLTIAQGGNQACFTQKDMERVLAGPDSEARQYKCAANIMWQDMTWMSNHCTPVNTRQLKSIIGGLDPFKPPAVLSPP